MRFSGNLPYLWCRNTWVTTVNNRDGYMLNMIESQKW